MAVQSSASWTLPEMELRRTIRLVRFIKRKHQQLDTGKAALCLAQLCEQELLTEFEQFLIQGAVIAIAGNHVSHSFAYADLAPVPVCFA
jgi:hypothetical protein